MNKKISIKEFSPELQRAIAKEVSTRRHSKRVRSKTELSDEAKAFLDAVVKGTWTQREDGKIDVTGSVEAVRNPTLHLFMGKEIFFGNVTESFTCPYTKITSLQGAPKVVGGDFYCNYTKITSLEGAPREVGGVFNCSRTKITSLKGAPKVVGGDFECYMTQITSLEGSPREVGGNFDCSHTKITSLDGIGEVKGRIYSDRK